MQQGLPYLPQEQASRDQSGGVMGLLQQLLGREGQPNLPPMQDDSSVLTKAFNDAQGIDPEKRRRIQEILEGRTSNDAARGPRPAGPMTPGDSSANPDKEKEEDAPWFTDPLAPLKIPGYDS